MRKRGNIIFVLVVVLIVGFFAYKEIYKKINNANLQRQIKTISSATNASKSSFKNTAQAVTLEADETKNFEVGKDIEPGLYDISTSSDARITANLLITKDTPSQNILLSTGQTINISEAGNIVLIPSKLEKLTLEKRATSEDYLIPSQGFYYEGSQIPAGKYKVITENLPVLAKSPKFTVAFQDVAIGSAVFSKEGYPETKNMKNVNATAGKQKEIIFELKKNQFVFVQYSLPPKNLKVYLEKLED